MINIYLNFGTYFLKKKNLKLYTHYKGNFKKKVNSMIIVSNFLQTERKLQRLGYHDHMASFGNIFDFMRRALLNIIHLEFFFHDWIIMAQHVNSSHRPIFLLCQQPFLWHIFCEKLTWSYQHFCQFQVLSWQNIARLSWKF